ncbi:MAG TPA: carboxymuconolactone decarboxylase family protein [Steroidobacteraceae bacterium]|nr:carboxymuconolactone decarboxylase family protein [Steroidobacteraceae bacterium]
MTDAPVPRIAPLLPPDWDAEAYDVMSTLPHGRDNVLEGWRTGKPVAGTHLVCTQLRHPALAKAFLTFNAHFFYASKLPDRVREILILRIGWLRHADYEFIAHVELGRRAGLTDADIEHIKLGPTAAGLAPEDALLLRAVDELKSEARIGAGTWTLLARRFDAQQLLELIFIVGCYEMLAMALNSVEIQLEPGIAPLAATAAGPPRKP